MDFEASEDDFQSWTPCEMYGHDYSLCDLDDGTTVYSCSECGEPGDSD